MFGVQRSGFSDIKRRESVAEHTWLVSLLALIFLSETRNKDIDESKLLKLSILHDLAEAVTGDIPTHDQVDLDKKFKDEEDAIDKITALLPSSSREEIRELWEDYEEQGSFESQIVKALDKIEVGFQHNIADFSTWDENDKAYPLDYADKYSKIDNFIRVLNKINIEWRKKKTVSK